MTYQCFDEKQTIRKKMLQCRKELTAQALEAAGRRLMEQLFSLSEFLECRTVFSYLSYQREIPTLHLIEEICKTGRKVAVPKVIGEGEMEFFSIASLSDCMPGAYGILEPKAGIAAVSDAGERPVMLLPGLAFTKSGDRLGYGGGYYDRYLKRHPDFFKVAPAYEFSVLPRLPVKKHDIKADLVLLV